MVDRFIYIKWCWTRYLREGSLHQPTIDVLGNYSWDVDILIHHKCTYSERAREEENGIWEPRKSEEKSHVIAKKSGTRIWWNVVKWTSRGGFSSSHPSKSFPDLHCVKWFLSGKGKGNPGENRKQRTKVRNERDRDLDLVRRAKKKSRLCDLIWCRIAVQRQNVSAMAMGIHTTLLR